MCNRLLDAQDAQGRARRLTQAIFLAAHGIGDQRNAAAILEVVEALDGTLIKLGDMLDASQGEQGPTQQVA